MVSEGNLKKFLRADYFLFQKIQNHTWETVKKSGSLEEVKKAVLYRSREIDEDGFDSEFDSNVKTIEEIIGSKMCPQWLDNMVKDYIIKLPEGMDVPPESTKIHGITNEMMLKGRNIEQVLYEFNDDFISPVFLFYNILKM